MTPTCYRSIHEIDSAAWDALNPSRYPGVLHGFLSALEDSQSVGPGTGWDPFYMVLTDERGLAAALACFLKTHSYGEYVFDFAWADAYYRNGLNYYPKCLIAAPFTPSSGVRFLVRSDLDHKNTAKYLLDVMRSEFDNEVSSYHVLFPDERDSEYLSKAGWIERHGVQFHWVNRGFSSFADHLATFNSRRRKEVRRERRRVQEQGITFVHRTGRELTKELLEVIYQCYQTTHTIRGREGYLTEEFFSLAANRIPEALAVAFAERNDTPIAMSYCFRDSSTLYGRYWGSLEYVDCLHFDTCFHQWIDYAIRHGVKRFDPGAQGEHKIARGFAPVITRSFHFIQHPEFRDAIMRHVRQENFYIQGYFQACDNSTPFKTPDIELKI